MNTEIIKVSLRYDAIYIPKKDTNTITKINKNTFNLIRNCRKLGYTFNEDLLTVINNLNGNEVFSIFDTLRTISGVKKNWTPLVRQWDIPTNESIYDHFQTIISKILKKENGVKLRCGCLIPYDTFPLQKYNGCPFCGTPFGEEKLDLKIKECQLTELKLWKESDLENVFISLLESNVALDANGVDSLKILLKNIAIPSFINIKMKETLILVIDSLVEQNKPEIASRFFNSPNDILRYLWFKHTGFLQIVEPKTILKRKYINNNLHSSKKRTYEAIKEELKLKFDRPTSRMYANWLNALTMNIESQYESMHAKRSIWVRVIRALRLVEFSKKKGYNNLNALMKIFHSEHHKVLAGRISYFRLKGDVENTMALLKTRPGLFARSLFANMVWFGSETVLSHFIEIGEQVSSRLLLSINMYSDIYFNDSSRIVNPLGGVSKRISSNKYLDYYSEREKLNMINDVREMTLKILKRKFKSQTNLNKTIYIDPTLFNIPLPIGDRSVSLQDQTNVLIGTRFKVEGNSLRLFMQWGGGLAAQHLDMDLSCKISYENRIDFCSYSRLVTQGCKHSGDIQRIPSLVGTAEYIEIDINKLTSLGAKYVIFTCNAFTNGSISPNLEVGWMNSKYPMKISSKGVAFDPQDVQHKIRITQDLVKGLIFGILDLQSREVIWLEQSFHGQTVHNMNIKSVKTLVRRLESKISIGELLEIKSEAQGLSRLYSKEFSDETYTSEWAKNSSIVANTIID